MPIPETLTKIRIAGDVRHPLSGAPGTGTVEIIFGYAIRDTGNDIIFAPGVITATVTAGTFTTDEFVNPRQAGISPTNQPLTVRVLTDVYADEYQIEIPADSTGTLQLSDLAPAESPPAVVSYVLVSQLADYLPKAGGTLTGAVTWNGTPSASGHLVNKAALDAAVAAAEGGSGAWTSPPPFDVEEYGAVGDGVTDDYPAIRAAWDAMLASPVGGVLFFPRIAVYRIDASVPGRLAVTADKARALLPLPMRLRNLDKITFGVLGVGDPYVVRTADLGASPGKVFTASVLLVDYDTPFTWSPSTGIPSVIGAPDADATDPTGNTFSNLHFTITNMIIRQPPNPSLCAVNLEQVSTMRVDGLRVDVDAVLDDVPLPTHPTGCGLLASRTNNNVVVEVDRFIAEGQFAGGPVTEHLHARTMIALRCLIAVHNRRACSHPGVIDHLKVEQCTWGIAGYDPSAATAEGAVVTARGWTGRIGLLGIEDYANRGTTPGFYTPTAGAHVFDESGVLNGTVAMVSRVNSEPPAPDGIGIGPGGVSQSLYIRGPGGTTASPMAFFGLNHTVAATRLSPPSAPEVTEYRLWPATDGPAESVTDSQPINLATEIAPSTAVEATELHFWRGNLDVTGAITGRLWEITGVGTGVAVPGSDVTFDIGSTTGWKTAVFTAPIALDPTKRYAATVHFPDRWCRTTSYWDSGAGGSGIVNGPLRAFSNADSVGGQGKFSSGEITNYPASSGGGSNYWVDVTVVDA